MERNARRMEVQENTVQKSGYETLQCYG